MEICQAVGRSYLKLEDQHKQPKKSYIKKYTIYPTIYLIILSLLDLEIIWFGVGRAPQKRAILISLRKLIQAHWISFQFEHDISMIKIYQNECVEQSQGAHRPTA